MSINDRFQLIIDTQFRGNKRAFSIAIGVSPTVIENVVGSRKGKPSYELLCKVCANANISEQWLLTGQGEILKSSNPSDVAHINEGGIEKNPHQRHPDVEIETRPRIPLEAAAGSLSILTQSVDQNQCEQVPVITSLPDYDFTITVKGDSMMPEFKSGDEVACRLVRKSGFIRWGQPYVIDSYDGIVLKRIHDDGDNINCISDNPKYDAFPIPKSEIYRLALVVGMVRSY